MNDFWLVHNSMIFVIGGYSDCYHYLLSSLISLFEVMRFVCLTYCHFPVMRGTDQPNGKNAYHSE